AYCNQSCLQQRVVKEDAVERSRGHVREGSDPPTVTSGIMGAAVTQNGKDRDVPEFVRREAGRGVAWGSHRWCQETLIVRGAESHASDRMARDPRRHAGGSGIGPV